MILTHARPPARFLVPILTGALLAIALATFLAAGTASADAGPHRGAAFGQAPDECAACHRVHTGQGPKLLAGATQADLCLSCHNGTGADTNVVAGVYEASSLGLKGGGFSSVLMDTSLSGTPVSGTSTSNHTTSGAAGTAWGGGAIGSGPGAAVTLECANCHDPHGNGQYRLLRKIPLESGAGSDVIIADPAVKDYDIAYNPDHRRDTSYVPDALASWCSQCHTRYLTGFGSGSADSGDPIFKYRHASTDLLADGCGTCHVAHGTSATMGTWSGAQLWPNNAGGGGSTDSRLLQLDNRGVCSNCHVVDGSVTITGSCTACHGQPPATGGHDSHMTATYGPSIAACDSCHLYSEPTHRDGTVTFADGNPLATTNACDACHSPGGTYNGVGDATVGAKANWAAGVYAAGDLKIGKELWCATCHDESPATIQSVAAPSVIGNESAATNYGTGYGYYKTGHGLSSASTYPATGDTGAGLGCTSCHDPTAAHIDGVHRTFSASSDNYQAGYRLKSVSGLPPMDIPLGGSGSPAAADYRLCFQCHTNSSDYLVQDNSGSNFRKPDNRGYHFKHLDRNGNAWNADWRWSGSNPVDNSRISCVACHNVHGSEQPNMIRHGELVSTPGTTDQVPYLDFEWKPTGTYPSLADSTGGQCAAECHGSKGYDRTPILWP